MGKSIRVEKLQMTAGGGLTQNHGNERQTSEGRLNGVETLINFVSIHMSTACMVFH